MSNIFHINLNWERSGEFEYEKFNRNHKITLGGNQVINNSAASEYLGNAGMSNPEELLASALASCHMLTFLAVACKSGYTVDSYIDNATATLDKNEEGKLAVTVIDLKPEVIFSGEKIPNQEQLKSLHEKAHRNCFIANSIKTKVNVL
ncbi:MAG: OsmC family protein [Bacteriovorax sp.]|jgi:organic hydroperoxide reductase OsmC/OhrA